MMVQKEGKLIEGRELQSIRLCRVMHNNLRHRGFQWRLGENIDSLPFNARGSCEPGGLYFTTFDRLHCYMDWLDKSENPLDYWLAEVSVADDEPVWQEPCGKWKAQRVQVDHLRKLSSLPESELFELVTGMQLLWRGKQSWLQAVQRDSHLISCVPDQTEELCRASVAQDGRNLLWLREPTLELAQWAVEQDPINAKWVHSGFLPRLQQHFPEGSVEHTAVEWEMEQLNQEMEQLNQEMEQLNQEMEQLNQKNKSKLYLLLQQQRHQQCH